MEKIESSGNDPLVLSAAETLSEGRIENEVSILCEIEVEEVAIDGICGVY